MWMLQSSAGIQLWQVHMMLLFWPTDVAFKPCGGPALTSSTHNLLSKMSRKGRIYQTKKRYEQKAGDSLYAHVQRCSHHLLPCWLHHGRHHGVQHTHALPGEWSRCILALPPPHPPLQCFKWDNCVSPACAHVHQKSWNCSSLCSHRICIYF